MKRALYKSIRQYAKSLTRYSEKVSVKFDPDTIHALRSNFKKLRALLRWQRENREIYTPFKSIYDVAGEIRIVQVATEMLEKKGRAPGAFRNWLSIRLLNKKRRWSGMCNKRILSRLQGEIENIQVHHRGIKPFFKKRIEEIGNIIVAKPVSDIALHDVRKKVKDMQYVLQWLKDRDIKKDFAKDISVSQLKHIGKQIGAYNDTRMLLVLLNAYRRQEAPRAVTSNIQRLIHRWREDKAMQREELISQLHEVEWLSRADRRHYSSSAKK